jgi:hypothetical protein
MNRTKRKKIKEAKKKETMIEEVFEGIKDKKD